MRSNAELCMFHIRLYCILLTLDCISYLPFILSNAAVIYIPLSLSLSHPLSLSLSLSLL
jgi:hypothetical protein